MSGRSVLVGGDDDIAVLPAPTFKQIEQRQQGTCWTTKKQPAGCFFCCDRQDYPAGQYRVLNVTD